MTLLIAFGILLVVWALWEYKRRISVDDVHIAGCSQDAAVRGPDHPLIRVLKAGFSGPVVAPMRLETLNQHITGLRR